MEWLGIATIPALGLAWWVLRRQRAARWQYRSVTALLSPVERRFARHLKIAIGPHYRLYCKVRAAELLKPKAPQQSRQWQAAYQAISEKSLDFVLCDPDSLAPKAVLTLEEFGLLDGPGRVRDPLLEHACQSAGIPLLRFPLKGTVSVAALRRALSPSLPKLAQASEVEQEVERFLAALSPGEANRPTAASPTRRQPAQPPAREQLSTEMLAQRLGMTPQQLVQRFVQLGYLVFDSRGQLQLTDKAQRAGARQISAYPDPTDFLWQVGQQGGERRALH